MCLRSRPSFAPPPRGCCARRSGGAPTPSCYTFGSPPVLAHEQGGGGHRVLEAAGLPPGGCVHNFVLEVRLTPADTCLLHVGLRTLAGLPPSCCASLSLCSSAALPRLLLPADSTSLPLPQNDPVPRALLSVDPTFELLKRWSGFQGLLQLRGLLSPGGPVSPDRFLFECVGDVHLIKWTPEGDTAWPCMAIAAWCSALSCLHACQHLARAAAAVVIAAAAAVACRAGGSQVVPLDAHEMERELSLLPQQPQPAAAAAAADTAAAGGFAAAVSSLLTPVRGLQAWLDHHHGSYAQEIEAAALRSVRHRLQPSRSGSSNGSSAASA